MSRCHAIGGGSASWRARYRAHLAGGIAMLHHEESIAAFVESARADGACDAVIVEGSVARGTERADSDVDLYLLVGDETFGKARRDGRLSYVTADGIAYEGGYF